MNLNFYAQRLLNPFRGVMNVIECQGAEAVTTDGVHWDIYVRDTDLVQDLANSTRVQTSDIRYGSWSRERGLKRGTLYPSEDFRVLEQRGAVVYHALLERHAEVPFALMDRFELWLLDTAGLPLALLHSAVQERDIELDLPIDWRAGRECRRAFQSTAMQALREAAGDAAAGDYLTRLVNERAGSSPQAQWFRRRSDDSGEGLQGINLASGRQRRSLPAGAFPPFYLSDNGDNRDQHMLIHDFIAWQAPCILLRHDLQPGMRVRFERLASARALALDKHYPLYPEIIDQELVNVARVEAALRRRQPDPEPQDDTLATYYIELNVSRTN